MIQYDLTNTTLAHMTASIDVPSMAELTVITVALALASRCALSDIGRRELELCDENIDSVARILRCELSKFLEDLRVSSSVEARLAELRGLRISRIGI